MPVRIRVCAFVGREAFFVVSCVVGGFVLFHVDADLVETFFHILPTCSGASGECGVVGTTFFHCMYPFRVSLLVALELLFVLCHYPIVVFSCPPLRL